MHDDNSRYCNICNFTMTVHDKVTVLNKYDVTYFICQNCGFIQTESPYWLDEAYSKVINSADTWVIWRNLKNSADMLFMLKFIKHDNCLDFGGGHGILTRIMRDYGYNFYHYDKYAENLFSIGFEGDLSKRYDLVTAFENFEHFVDPMDEIEKIMSITDTLFFTTSLIPQNTPLINDWIYFAPVHGQHVSFYSKNALEFIARKFNLYLLTDNGSCHILSKSKLNKRILLLLKCYRKINKLIDIKVLFTKQSKTVDDHMRLIK